MTLMETNIPVYLPDWRGKKSAVFLIVGFGAVLFTFFGNYIFQGLHSYR